MNTTVFLEYLNGSTRLAKALRSFSGAALAAFALTGLVFTPSVLRAAPPISGAIFTTDSTCTEVNVNIYEHKADVYIDGGPEHPGSAGLPDGSYCVQVTDPSGHTVLGLSAPGAVTVVDGEFVECYQLTTILNTASSGFTAPGFDDTPNPGGEYKVWVSTDCNFENNNTKTDNFQVQEECEKGVVNVTSFYDANADGVQDHGEPDMVGWKFRAFGHDNLHITKETPNHAKVLVGAYTAVALDPNERSWVPTTPVKVEFTVDEYSVNPVNYGCVCLGTGGANTIAFWSNKSGQSMTNADDLAFLSVLYLRSSRGADYNPTTPKSLSSWGLNANTTNMAYMLSMQLATMQLNVRHAFVNGNALVHAPALLKYGTVAGLNTLGFISINDLMVAASAEIQAHGLTTSTSPYRSYQEALNSALDDANSNKIFVQDSPCDFSFGE